MGGRSHALLVKGPQILQKVVLAFTKVNKYSVVKLEKCIITPFFRRVQTSVQNVPPKLSFTGLNFVHK